MRQTRPTIDGDSDQHRLFMKRLLADLRALEHMIAEGMIETGVRRIGAEQELVLVDRAWRPAGVAVDVLDRLDDDRFTTELACFNLEFNTDPIRFGGSCLSRLERDINDLLARVRGMAEDHGAGVMLAGILPTIRKSDLDISNMTPQPRYHALNNALRDLRGGAFELRFTGTDELIIRHDSVMLEACNASCQVHFQVGPEEFARLYNIAQVVAAPVLAAAVNSPLLFGLRLWQETRIALFQQAVDTRSPGHQVQHRSARVSFGNHWVKASAIEIFREDIARFRVVLPMLTDEDPFEEIRSGRVPHLRALQLHNSTVYRWNRPCYGISDGKPHLRIENRILPSGPTVVDEVANAAFWLGLMGGVADTYGDVTERMDFDDAKANFLTAARLGLDAGLTWLDGERRPARELICGTLIPMARKGLHASGIAPADIDRYIGVVEERVASGRTGAQWLLDSLTAMKDTGADAERLAALTSATCARQHVGEPVHTWPLAQRSEGGGWPQHYVRVEQYMTTDVFTVHEDDVIDLVANLMDWQHIRHVPVEDAQHRLVGLVSYRALLRVLGRDLPHGQDSPVPVSTIMQRDPITVTPETTTRDAIELMRRRKVACLPVVADERLVGVVTERNFMDLAAHLLDGLPE
ncbi:MAG: glutamate-cysteine ligase family protein [Phycisphaerae bacterium]